MRRLLATVAAVVVAGATGAQEPASPKPSPVEMKATGTPGKAEARRSAKATATVKAVDVANRTVTLQNEAGATQTFKVGPEVKRLDEFAVGDTIVVEYEQGLALEFQPAGSETVAPTATTAGAVAGKDQAPGAVAAAGIQATVTVTAIDQGKRLVSFQGPGGNVYQVKAGPKIQLEKLKVGDRLLATYVEAVALKLEKPKQKPTQKSK
jgi:Cu/Ag efflux protein CusF